VTFQRLVPDPVPEGYSVITSDFTLNGQTAHIELLVCDECRTVVSDPVGHNAWHDDMRVSTDEDFVAEQISPFVQPLRRKLSQIEGQIDDLQRHLT